MKKVFVKYLFAVLILASAGTAELHAQKFGYLNSAALLQLMPEVREAEANLQTFQEQLQKKGQQMLEQFQAKYQELERKNSQGEISPKQLQEETKALQDEEAKIAQFERDMQQQILGKREDLLQPILDDVNAAIQEVASEHGYSYIFDASPGGGILLYADETTDVMDLVKAKLGL